MFFSGTEWFKSDSWVTFPLGGTHPPTSKSLQLHAQTAEMGQAGLDSSILSPFLSEPDLDHPKTMPPPEGLYLDANSEEYFQKLVKALELDGPMYSHVDPYIMSQFKQITKNDLILNLTPENRL